ncbi:hypothetical protein [Mesorhizobium sp.]|uniref:hypothetical protein n=1 Tax=Mesorhizobium sp. TaxID=1871066 RepID=UPI000FE5B860|nr:hypothetical protein [Mesorhizobium sp.]RWQ51434.1 MAG: hypothetical protein EOS84_19965 [Mesorhizobium sp.]
MHHSFSLKRQQIIKPCRVQPDRDTFNAIGTVFNTFWPRLATVFLDLMHVAQSVQRFCGNDMQKNNNLKRVADQTRRASGRIVLPFQAICRTGIASQGVLT